MWEEHPEYQKLQARVIGLGVSALAALYIIDAVAQHDWDLLKQVLVFVGAFVVAFGLVFGFVWLLVKIFTRRQTDAPKNLDRHDA